MSCRVSPDEQSGLWQPTRAGSSSSHIAQKAAAMRALAAGRLASPSTSVQAGASARCHRGSEIPGNNGEVGKGSSIRALCTNSGETRAHAKRAAVCGWADAR